MCVHYTNACEINSRVATRSIRSRSRERTPSIPNHRISCILLLRNCCSAITEPPTVMNFENVHAKHTPCMRIGLKLEHRPWDRVSVISLNFYQKANVDI